MNAVPLQAVVEGLSEAERAERAEYAARLRRMPLFDVMTEGAYYEGQLEELGEMLLREDAGGGEPQEAENGAEDGQLAFVGYLVAEYRWKRDAVFAEKESRQRRRWIPMPGAVAVDPAWVQNVKERVSLVDLIEESGVELKKAGREYWGRCPFHEEKTPSFHVNAEKGVYYCHGCRAQGDVISYLMRYNGDEFVPTIRRLGGLVGMEMPSPTGMKRCRVQ